jgi:hypothetical protein
MDVPVSVLPITHLHLWHHIFYRDARPYLLTQFPLTLLIVGAEMMKSSLALILCLILPIALIASDSEPSFKVKYDGGSLPNAKAGSNLALYIDSNSVRIAQGQTEIANISPSSITEVSYGQDVHRRIGAAIGLAVVSLGIGALMALTKSKKHFVGVTWAEKDKKGGFAMQCDKNDYRGIIAALEGVSGKKAVNSDAMTVKN